MARILIIDDEQPIRMMLRMMLESEGHTVTEAADGTEGIKLFRQDPQDLVITDLIMPEKEGIETIMELRKDYPEVKVIAISGGGRNNPEWYLKTAKLLGAKEVLVKPIRKEALLTVIRNLI